MTPPNEPHETPEEKPEVPPRRLQPQGTHGDSQTPSDAPHVSGYSPLDRSAATPDDAPQRRKERGAAAGGANEPNRHREEVAGGESEGTAGGPSANAQSEDASTQQSAVDPALQFDPAVLSGGGGLSNTPPSIPKFDSTEVSETEVTTGGEDWFEVSLYLKHHRFAGLERLLETAKAAAETNRSPADEVRLGKLHAVCLARSAYRGDRITYRWQLRTSWGWLIQLMNRAEPHETLPNGIIRITSIPLMRFGSGACWARVEEWMEALGAEVVRACIGRVDLCVDLPGTEIDQLDRPYRLGHYVSRARLSAEYGLETPLVNHRFGRQSTGFRLGGGDKRVRAYDKLRETQNEPEKRALLVARRWGGLPKAASRVEFQLRREALKEYGIDSVDDYFGKRDAVAWDLCANWFRLTEGPVDPKHPERSRVLPLWWDVAKAFADWAGDSIEVDLTPLPKGIVDLDHLKKQLYGLTQSILVRSEVSVESVEDFAHEGMNLLLAIAEARDIGKEFRRKAFDLGLLAEEET